MRISDLIVNFLHIIHIKLNCDFSLFVWWQAKRLKAVMMAAAELAALRLKDLPSASHKGMEIDRRDGIFRLLDKNGDGKISIEELMEVMEELGAEGEDAREMMQLLDCNSDGSLSSDEFDLFQKQVYIYFIFIYLV